LGVVRLVTADATDGAALSEPVFEALPGRRPDRHRARHPDRTRPSQPVPAAVRHVIHLAGWAQRCARASRPWSGPIIATPSASEIRNRGSSPRPLPRRGDAPVDEMPGDRLTHPSRVPLKVPLAASEVFSSILEKASQPGAPLRNRTVDLLLTMNPRQVPSPQVSHADLAEHEHARALASSR
jgi:hypothetical protein